MSRTITRLLATSMLATVLFSLTGCHDPTTTGPQLGDTRIDEDGQAWRLIDFPDDTPYQERQWVRIARADPE